MSDIGQVLKSREQLTWRYPISRARTVTFSVMSGGLQCVSQPRFSKSQCIAARTFGRPISMNPGVSLLYLEAQNRLYLLQNRQRGFHTP